MTGEYEDLKFLMASQNRLEVLLSIAESPMSKDELVDTVGSSPVTIGRIIDDFQERAWIKPQDGKFSVTLFGHLIAEDAADLEQSVAIAHRFRPVAEYCELSDVDFDPRLLEHATTSVGPEDTAFYHVDRWAELFRRTNSFKGITGHVPATILQVLSEEIRTNQMHVEGVFPASLVENIAYDPGKLAAARSMLEGGAQLYRDDKAWEIAIGIYDEEAMSFVGFDERGSPRFKIESDHPELVSWALDRFSSARNRSTPIEFDQLTV